MTTLLKKDYGYSSVLWEEVIQRVQEIIRDEYNVSPYIAPTLNLKTPSPFRIWTQAQSTEALYGGAWHKEYTISVNHYLKTEDSERFYRKVYEESERLYQLFFNNQGTKSTEILGFFGGEPGGIQITQEGDYFRIEVLFSCQVFRADDVVYVVTAPSSIRARTRAIEPAFNFWSLDFDGTDDYISIPDLNLTGVFTISVWINVHSIGYDAIVGNSSANRTWRFQNSLETMILWTATGISTFDISSYPVSENTWTHLVITRDSSNSCNIFVNSNLADTQTRDGTCDFDAIGMKNDEGEFDGLMSEFSVFNTVLSSSEIESIYNDGQPILLTENQGGYKSSSNLVAYYRMGSGSGDNRITTGYIADQVDSSIGSEMVDNGGFDGISNGTNVTSLDDWTAYGTAISTTIEDGKLRIISDALNEGATLAITGATNDAFYRLTCDVTGDLGLYSVYGRTVEGNANISTTNGSVDIVLVGYASTVSAIFRAGTGTSGGTSYYDNISIKPLNGNVGSMVNFDSLDFRTNVPQIYDKALFSNSLQFDGTDDYVDCGDAVLTSYPFTITGWVKPVDGANLQPLTLSDVSASNVYFLISWNGATDSAFQIQARNTDLKKINSATYGSVSGWYHIVGVFTSATDRTLYVNGVKDHSGEENLDSVTFSSDIDTTTIGALNRPSPGYGTGNISDVAIYNSALDATNVTAMYNSGKPIDLTCDAGNYNNANNLVGYWKMGDGYLDELPSLSPGLIIDQVTPIIGEELVVDNPYVADYYDLYGSNTITTISGQSVTINYEDDNAGVKIYLNNTVYTDAIGILNSNPTDNEMYLISIDVNTNGTGQLFLQNVTAGNVYSQVTGSGTHKFLFKEKPASSATVRIINFSSGGGTYMTWSNISVKKVEGNPGFTHNMNASSQSISVPE